MENLFDYIIMAQEYVNQLCEGKPAWEIILRTAVTTIILVWAKSFLFKNESLLERGKKTVFKLARKVPAVKARIEEEIEKVAVSMTQDLNKAIENTPYLTKLPEEGWSPEQIMEEATKYTKFGSYNWESGCASGTVYNGNKTLTDIMTRVYGMSTWTNPLHPDVFPGVRKMEAEVVRMCCTLFNGDARSCGCMTTGGTESIIMACKAYREYAINVRGIKNPEILVPVSAHAAFDKGAQLLMMRIRHVPLDPVTMKVDMVAMRKMINRNTCMLAGSAPQFPHGVIDPIEEIGALGIECNIPVHVDACLGGFLIPFMDDAGFPLSPFDFRVKGVTSISADTHKYGYAPKGSSVIMYREAKWRHHQFFVTPDWQGGIYATATIGGSRSGGIVAACWAALMYHGIQGYVDYTRMVIETTKKIELGCRGIPGIFIYGKPEVSVVALGSKSFNIYALSDRMTKRGWNLNALQFPSSIHIAVTVLHTQPGVAERFITDIKEIAEELLKNPCKDSGGSVLSGKCRSQLLHCKVFQDRQHNSNTNGKWSIITLI
ncbi:sphingosine-1-phosphate lyase 1 isoform X2 [Panulirus ornatus]|uniref:sphingosine-1-phosphate lyase 1 isoform X2 n=1 Tax=Panulirus ornatus TaxID=150431 RepID=UPI003A84FB1F